VQKQTAKRFSVKTMCRLGSEPFIIVRDDWLVFASSSFITGIAFDLVARFRKSNPNFRLVKAQKRRKFMKAEAWEVVDEVAGDLQAEIIRSLLESYGIQVWLSQEGAGRVYQMSVGTLGRAQILVPGNQLDEARQVLKKYYAGDLALPEDDHSDEGEDSEP
jgi:hypothetical protein